MTEDLFASVIQRAKTPQMDVGELLSAAEKIKKAGGADALSQVAELYKTWIGYHSDHPALHAINFNYGISLGDMNDMAGAVTAFRESIRQKPDFYPSYVNLGSMLERMGQADKGVAVWNSMVQSMPAVTGEAVSYKLTGLKQMGRVLETANSDHVAEEVLRQSLEINQDQPDVMQHFISLRQRQCKWPPIEGSEKVEKKRLVGAISPLSVACYADDPMFHLACSYKYNRQSIGFPKTKVKGELPAKMNKGKLRIGYVSSDLRHHAVGFAMNDVFESHDRKKFEIFAYYCGIKTSDTTQDRAKKTVDHWIDINDMNDEQAAQKIRDDKIDILIDLNGYTKDARTKVFALRPAPVNVNWFGFPNSMGSPYHHYIIADDYVIPPEYEIFYSEKVLRLPCYQPNDRKRLVSPNRPTRESVGLPEDAMVFCSLNGMQKITQHVFERWLLILHETPNSVLWLLTGTDAANQRLRERAATHGIAPERFVFASKMANPEHLARYVLADLFLDSFPYGAHTTASDSMWMGVPILTMAGRTFAARVCADLVTAAGFPELIAKNPEDYVRKAIELGKDRAALKKLNKRLLEAREKSLLFDTPKLVQHLEKLFVQMRDEYDAGKRPVPDLRNLELYLEIGVEEELENMGLRSNDDYIARYRTRLAEINELYPVPEDARLWNKKPIKLP